MEEEGVLYSLSFSSCCSYYNGEGAYLQERRVNFASVKAKTFFSSSFNWPPLKVSCTHCFWTLIHNSFMSHKILADAIVWVDKVVLNLSQIIRRLTFLTPSFTTLFI